MQKQLSIEATPVFTPSEIQKLIEVKVNSLLLNSNLSFVIVEGILGELKLKPTGYYTGTLKDVTKNASLTLDLNETLFKKGIPYQHKPVRIQGILKPVMRQGIEVQYVVDVSKLEPKVELNDELKEHETSLFELIRTSKKTSTSFPERDRYKITVIHPQSSFVVADFENRLEDLIKKNYVTITHKPVNILDSDSIIKAIRGSSGDIVLIIRGGGNDGEFEVFNTPQLIKAWTEVDAFRITAIGHSEHRTIIDFFSHYSADTPTEAGVYIMRRIEEVRMLKEYRDGLTKHREETVGYMKKIQELQNRVYKLSIYRTTTVVLSLLLFGLVLYLLIQK